MPDVAELPRAEITTFTDEDIAVGPTLGPEYRASLRWAEAIANELNEEALRPLIDDFTKQFAEKLWDSAASSLLSDTEYNMAGSVRHMVEQTVQALLTGQEWAMARYPYADYSKGEEIRKAVAKHGGDNLLMRRIVDLEAELAKKEETIQWMRR